MTYTINTTHQPVIDQTWNGVDLFQVTDVDQLITWWNKLIRYAGAVNTIREKQAGRTAKYVVGAHQPGASKTDTSI